MAKKRRVVVKPKVVKPKKAVKSKKSKLPPMESRIPEQVPPPRVRTW